MKDTDRSPVQGLVDAFAEARRTWNDLATMQPDQLANGAALRKEDLAELEKRVGVHYEAVQSLVNALDRAWSD